VAAAKDAFTWLSLRPSCTLSIILDGFSARIFNNVGIHRWNFLVTILLVWGHIVQFHYDTYLHRLASNWYMSTRSFSFSKAIRSFAVFYIFLMNTITLHSKRNKENKWIPDFPDVKQDAICGRMAGVGGWQE
jgi:hypothetical protein